LIGNEPGLPVAGTGKDIDLASSKSCCKIRPNKPPEAKESLPTHFQRANLLEGTFKGSRFGKVPTGNDWGTEKRDVDVPW